MANNEEKLTIKDLLVECNGEDELGKTKVEAWFFHERFNFSGDMIEQVETMSFTKPVVHIFRNLGIFQIDFIYQSKEDLDLRMQWEFLQRYSSFENSIDDEEGNYPIVTMMLFPRKYNYKYYIRASHPVFFTLQPHKVSTDPCVIRMLFNEDNVEFEYVSQKDISMQQINREVESELKSEEELQIDDM